MTEPCWPTALSKLRELARHNLGVECPDSALSSFAVAVRRTTQSLGLASDDALVGLAREADPRALAALAAELAGGEAFATPRELQAVREMILAPLLHSRPVTRPLLIWCAGCSTGEEAYALAMLCLEVDPRLTSDRVHILGTDVNPFRLEQASRATYGPWARRQKSPWPRHPLLEPLGDGDVRVAEPARRLVSFAEHNLLSGHPPAALAGLVALVCCRDVLSTLQPTDRRRALATLARSLEPRGWLALGDGERVSEREGWEVHERPGGLLHRRCNCRAPTVRRRAERRPVAPELPTGPAVREAGADFPGGPAALEAMAELERAIALEQRGDGAGAQEALHRALELDPQLAFAHVLTAGLHERQGRTDEARRHYRRVLCLLEGRAACAIVPQGNGVTVSFLREHSARRLARLADWDPPQLAAGD
jgi:chemotaxis protein methyltransferase CheR